MPVTTPTIKRYVSAITSLDQREIHPYVANIQNNYGFLDVMNAFGRYKPAKMYKYESYTNDSLWKEGVVDSVTGSPTSTGTIVLTQASSGGRRKNDSARLANGNICHVMNVATDGSGVDTVTLQSVDGTTIEVSAADKIKFYSNAVGERSISRESVFVGLTHYYNYLQIFNETHIESDVQKLSRVETADGRWSIKEYAEKFLKHKMEVNTAFISGQISNSSFAAGSPALTDPEGGGQIQYTRGLDQYIASYGINRDTDSQGSPDIDDIDGMIDLILAKKGGNRYNIFGANKPLRALDHYFKNLGSGGVTSARMNMDGQEINFMVERFQEGGFYFQKYNLPLLDHPDLYGGTTTAQDLYFTPEGKARVQDKEGYPTYEPCAQVRYKQQPANITKSGNGIWGEIHSGAYSPVNPNGERKEAKVDYTTTQGLEILGAQHFGRLRKVVS